MAYGRAGHYVDQPGGFRAFIPSRLPPDPDLAIDAELLTLLSRADTALGRLDGSSETLPNPDLFVAQYVRREAVLSSQIEGTEATFMDLLAYEAQALAADKRVSTAEVSNYVTALNEGLERLHELPVSLRLIRDIHGRLMQGVRGGDKTPGEFRRSQNWIGGNSPQTAKYVPPPVQDMNEALDSFEKFLHDPRPMPALIKIGLAHAQFETIHPFLDGNGRIGRLLISFLLCQQGTLKRPLLYLSVYLKRNQRLYYDTLQGIRDNGEWERWIKFFLTGVAEVSSEATGVARSIVSLRDRHHQLIRDKLGKGAANAQKLLESLFHGPLVSAQDAADRVGVTFPAANTMIDKLRDLGILVETTGMQRGRLFLYKEFVDYFQRGAS